MDVAFTVLDENTTIQRILEFQAEGETAFWSEHLYHFYPQLDKAWLFPRKRPISKAR